MKLKKLAEDILGEYLDEQQIFEDIKISEYRIEKQNNNKYTGYFNTNGLKYTVDVYHNDNKHKFGVWEVEFSVANQTNAGYRTKKDIQHFNTVLYTVFEIVQKIVNEINIKTIYIDSANDTFDKNVFDTIRGDIYYRFLKNKFGAENIDKQGRFITIDLSKEEYTKLEKIINILKDISDNHLDIDGINRGVNGIDDDNFEINTDYISNINVGDIYFEIIVNVKNKEYSLTYEILDTNVTESFNYKSFDDLINFLKDFKNKIKQNSYEQSSPPKKRVV
jgi:hypothetical protein